ncbi:serine/threonine-protein kinase [Pedobacter sp. CAN_A7]|uniref:serine/threonine protein kinase n=1 Tax=Pedobacter sp. CAN_A7 TaxID=2787722 RepID=UPI0018C940D4
MAKVFTITEGLENLGALRTGGQGSVYKARRGEQISAVKILPTPLHSEDENDKNYRDFQNEVSKLKKVNEEPNPHVVKILSSGITESGSLPFIEMEFIEGPDLEELIQVPRDKVFTIRETIKVAEQLSNALAHCHKVSVKHGDIKSNNVKFDTKSGNYMLLDFGLSVMTDEQRRTSLRHAGAIEFMAPEQNEGEMLLQSDVYSFGIILFELLAGTVPFPLNNQSETSRNMVMVSHMEQPVPDILDLREQNLPENWQQEIRDFEMLVPGWLLSVIAKCLEKNPGNRFDSGIKLHETILNSISSKDIFVYTSASAAAVLAGSAVSLADAPQLLATPEVLPSNQAKEENKAPGLSGNSFKNSFPEALRKFKPIVIGLGVLLACLALFGSYSILNKPEEEIVDTAALNLENEMLKDSLENERLKDSIDQAERLIAQPVQNPNAYLNKSPGKSKGKGRSKGKGHKNK